MYSYTRLIREGSVYIGKDNDTDYTKTVDGFLKNYYVANDPRRRMCPYKFTFGARTDPNEAIDGAYERETDAEYAFMSLEVTEESEFSAYEGYGFTEHGSFSAATAKKQTL